jgi:hypothetical protein
LKICCRSSIQIALRTKLIVTSTDEKYYLFPHVCSAHHAPWQSQICARYGNCILNYTSPIPGQMMRIQQRPKLQYQEGKASRPINMGEKGDSKIG